MADPPFAKQITMFHFQVHPATREEGGGGNGIGNTVLGICHLHKDENQDLSQLGEKTRDQMVKFVEKCMEKELEYEDLATDRDAKPEEEEVEAEEEEVTLGPAEQEALRRERRQLAEKDVGADRKDEAEMAQLRDAEQKKKLKESGRWLIPTRRFQPGMSLFNYYFLI